MMDDQLPTTKTTKAYPSKKIDVSKMLVLRYVKGLSYQDIANNLKVSKQAIAYRLNNLPSPDAVTDYEARRTRVLSAAELAMISLLFDPTKAEKASLNNVAYTFGQIHTARRVESGLSTSNVAYIDMLKLNSMISKDKSDIVQGRAEIEEELQNLQTDNMSNP